MQMLRSVVRAPGNFFASAAILGLGMSGALTIFAVVDAVLLDPLPFADAERLVEIRTERGGEDALLSMREALDLREQARDVLDGVAAYVPGSQYALAEDAGPEKAAAILVTRNFFDVLGVAPRHGGLWPATYDQERNFGLILSHRLWQRQFSGADVVGRTVAVDASPYFTPSYEIFGVMPEGFDFPVRTDLYRSFFVSSAFPGVDDRASRTVAGVARLAPGVDLERARAALDLLSDRLAREYPESNRGVRMIVRPLRDAYVADLRPYLLVLLAGSVVLLLTACANVANLVLTRTLARESELAVRTALGASRLRLLGSLAAGGAVLAGTGAAVAVVVAVVTTAALDGLALGLPTWMRFDLDASVLVFAAAIAAITALVVGLWPARTGLAADVMARLRQDTRGSAGARHRRLREGLVTAEVALSMTLLIGSALLARTFLELGRVDTGLDPENVLTFHVPLPWSYPAAEQVAFQEEAVRRLLELPGVVAAATNANPPLIDVGQPDRVVLEAEGQPEEARLENPYMNVQRVSPGYFDAMRIPLLEGRAFDPTLDRDSTLLTAVVSRRLADRLWPGEPAVGKRLRRPQEGAPWWEVVGVAGDVRFEGLTADGGFDVYLSSLQATDGWVYFLLRAQSDPSGLERAVEETIWGIDPLQPVIDFRTMEDRVAETVGPQRLAAALFGVFAVVAPALAAAGIFAVVSVLVRQRTGEIGVRMALGADGGRIVRRVLADTLVPTLIGVGAGLGGGALVAHGVRGLLYGVSPWDPVSFVLVPAGVVAVALLAALAPAQGAARLSHAQTFRGR
jgi:putative ABC transport system permease protein